MYSSSIAPIYCIKSGIKTALLVLRGTLTLIPIVKIQRLHVWRSNSRSIEISL